MQELRAEFPVFERLAYLNAGTNGPVPARAIAAAETELRFQAEWGRGAPDFLTEHWIAKCEVLRTRVARLLGCESDELALTTSTTAGINTILPALRLRDGDEVLTSDEEHPGLLAPLTVGRARDGFDVRVVPFDDLPGEIGPRTKLIAVSHVSWIGGKVADTEALKAAEIPLLLDGAQGLAAVPVDVKALGCDFYAASGQKWACGPNGLGYLYVRGELVNELLPPAPGFGSLANPERPLELRLEPTARRFDAGPPAPQNSAWALSALDVLDAPGIEALYERAAELAAGLAASLAEAGLEVAPRGRSTLVSWRADDPEDAVERLREQNIVVRSIAAFGLVRTSVGAWTSERELERLVELATA